MSEIGIYFGVDGISISRVDKKTTLVSNAFIPESQIFDSPQGQRVLDEQKAAAALKKEFSKLNIFPETVSISLSGEDVIIRTFELPIFISKRELQADTIAFEAKKYVPFKIEELIFDFRIFSDRQNKRKIVLFAGMKKETYDRFLSLFKQLQIGVDSMEYSGFNILRLLKSTGVKNRGVFAVLNANLTEESNLLVCQNNFPLFSHDIILAAKSETGDPRNNPAVDNLENSSSQINLKLTQRLQTELRITLDFFRRRFPDKGLKNLLILTSSKFQPELAALNKDLGLSPVFVKTAEFLGGRFDFSSSLIKSYATAIRKTQRLSCAIDFIQTNAEPTNVLDVLQSISLESLPISRDPVKLNLKVIFASCLIIASTFAFNLQRQAGISRELRALRASQPKSANRLSTKNIGELASLEQKLDDQVRVIEKMVKERPYLTYALNAIPRVIPEGVWLSSISLQMTKGQQLLRLIGSVSLSDTASEFAAVDSFVAELNKNSEFKKSFTVASLESIEKQQAQGVSQGKEVTQFQIIGHNPEE